MTASVDVQIPYPIKPVWELLTDVPRTAAFSPEVLSARWLTSGGCREGARFAARNCRGPYDWEVTCQVIIYHSPSEFSWVVGDPARPSSTWSYRLRPERGGTRILEHFQHGPASSWVRHMVNSAPAESATIIRQRQNMLEDDMRLTLRRAASILASDNL